MDYNKITLEFKDKSLEKEFKEKNDYSNRVYLRLGCVISAVMWMVVNIATYLLYPQHSAKILFLTISTILPLLSSILFVTLFEKDKRHYQWSTGLINLIIALIHLSLS